jgi:hypothetical protein
MPYIAYDLYHFLILTKKSEVTFSLSQTDNEWEISLCFLILQSVRNTKDNHVRKHQTVCCYSAHVPQSTLIPEDECFSSTH